MPSPQDQIITATDIQAGVQALVDAGVFASIEDPKAWDAALACFTAILQSAGRPVEVRNTAPMSS